MNVGLYLYSEGPWANRSCCHRSIDPGHRHIVVLRRFRVGRVSCNSGYAVKHKQKHYGHNRPFSTLGDPLRAAKGLKYTSGQ